LVGVLTSSYLIILCYL